MKFSWIGHLLKVVLFSAVFIPAFPQSPSAKNNTDLEIDYTPRAKNWTTYHSCKGKINKKAELDQIGITNKDIEIGIGCDRGDFDGNGYEDYFFYKRGMPESEILIVFLKGHKIIKTELIKDFFYSPPLTYASDRNDQGVRIKSLFVEFNEIDGCPVSNIDGIFEPGEGGNTKVLLYDPEKKEFRKYECPSEIHN